MGFGPARREIRQAVDVPDRVFLGSFETSDALGLDDIAYFNSLGSTDDDRLAAYVEQQLNHASIHRHQSRAADGQYPGAFAVMNQSMEAIFSTRVPGFDQYARPYFEIERPRSPAIYTKRQLFELMGISGTTTSTVRGGRRGHALHRVAFRGPRCDAHQLPGQFRRNAGDTAKHPAMLEYLDKYENSSGGFNENYARELFELHTLGAENYRGLQQPCRSRHSPSIPIPARRCAPRQRRRRLV